MADVLALLARFESSSTPGEAVKALQAIRRAVLSAAVKSANDAGFASRGAMSLESQAQEQKPLEKVRITKASVRKPRTLIRDQGWQERSYSFMKVNTAGETQSFSSGTYVFIPTRKSYATARKLDFALKGGFLAVLRSGKFGLFMRNTSARLPIELLFTLRPPEVVDAIRSKGEQVALEQADASFNEHYLKATAKIIK